ncbi:MAG: glycosyltransferase [Chitinophagales bacterium]
MQTLKPKVAVLLPVLNEIAVIEDLVAQLVAELTPYNFDVYFIDDGSTDGTLEFLQSRTITDPRLKLIARHKTGKGCKRGKALYDALHLALENGYAYFVEMDGDLSHNAKDLSKGLELLQKGYDVVIASKYLPESAIVKRSVFRNIISYFNSAIFRLFLKRSIKDYSNGYRFYNRTAAEKITACKIENEGPLYLGEVLALWIKNGLRIAEFPSVYNARGAGASKVIVKDVVTSFFGSVKIIVRYHFTGFKPVV